MDDARRRQSKHGLESVRTRNKCLASSNKIHVCNLTPTRVPESRITIRSRISRIDASVADFARSISKTTGLAINMA